jgi:hypothetical protein
MRTSLQRPAFLIVSLVIATLSCPCTRGQDAPGKRGLQSAGPNSTSQVKTGPYYALVIGNNDYLAAQKLETAINDANAIAEVLRNRYGFETKVLLDASRDDILGALNAYRRQLTEDSNLLIYYAGHGHHDKDTDEAYWLPVDAKLDDSSRWISADDITSALKAMPSRHVLIISDSCYSGALSIRDARAGINPEDQELYLAKVLGRKSRTIMASGGDEPVADGGGNGHSIFAEVVLESLRETDESNFTAADMFGKFVQRRVAGKSPQLPKYSSITRSGDDGGDFVFVRQGRAKFEIARAPVDLQPQKAVGRSLNSASPPPRPNISIPLPPVGTKFQVVHFIGTDVSQYCLGWMTIESFGITYQALRGTDGMHNFTFQFQAIRTADKFKVSEKDGEAFHLTMVNGEEHNFFASDPSTSRFMSPDTAVSSILGALLRHRASQLRN